MKFLRFFVVFAVVVTLLIAFNGPSQAHYGQRDRDNCIVRKWDRQQPQDVFAGFPKNSVLSIRNTHVAVLTRTQEELNFQQRAFENAGIGPWSLAERLNVPATYCGKDVQLKVEIRLTTDFKTTPGFFEIINIIDDTERTFFTDYYRIYGPSLLYVGLEPLPGVSYEQVLAFLREQNIPIVFHTEALGAILDFIRVGYTYVEIVTPQETTN